MTTAKIFAIEALAIWIILILPAAYNFFIVKPQYDEVRNKVVNYVFQKQTDLGKPQRVEQQTNGIFYTFPLNTQNTALLLLRIPTLRIFGDGSTVEVDITPPQPISPTLNKEKWVAELKPKIKDQRVLNIMQNPENGWYTASQPKNESDGLSDISYSTVPSVTWQFDRQVLYDHLNISAPKTKGRLFGLSFEGDPGIPISYFALFDVFFFSPLSRTVIAEIMALLLVVAIPFVISLSVFKNKPSFLKYNLLFIPSFIVLFAVHWILMFIVFILAHNFLGQAV